MGLRVVGGHRSIWDRVPVARRTSEGTGHGFPVILSRWSDGDLVPLRGTTSLVSQVRVVLLNEIWVFMIMLGGIGFLVSGLHGDRLEASIQKGLADIGPVLMLKKFLGAFYMCTLRHKYAK